jgi:hypothetical protein
MRAFMENGMHLITVNNFIHSDFADILQPTYHIFSDPLDFIDVPDSHPKAERARMGKKDKQRVMDRGIPLFVPIQYYDYHPKENTHFFYDVENIFSANVADLGRARGYMSWSGMKALAVACSLGYERIYFCGMDYDMFKSIQVHEDNKLYREVNHYYDDESHPKYEFHGGRYSIGEFLYMEHLNFMVHDKFAPYPLVNLNPKGLIDSLPKEHSLDIYRN